MNRKIALLCGAILVLLTIALALRAYPSLPDRVPTHWDFSGHVTGHSSRSFAATLVPAIMAFIWLLMIVLPLVSPQGFGVDRSASAFYISTLAILGNFMGKFKKNFWIGIRTPWTLASDEVWLRTNRLGGQLMVFGGVVLIASSLFGALAVPALVGVVIITVTVPMVYSYVPYKRIEGFENNA